MGLYIIDFKKFQLAELNNQNLQVEVKIVTDKVFDELKEADAYSWKWQGKYTIDFGG